MSKRHSALIVFSLFFCIAFTGGIALSETFAYYGEMVPPLTQTRNCDWELTIKDAQEYMYEEYGETLKKITTVDIFATKKDGTDYFGRYTGKGVITVFNALSPGEDAYPVLYGGQAAVSLEFSIDLRIERKTNILVPEWEFSPIEERDYDGISTLQYNIQLGTVRGIFQYAEEWPWLVGSPGIEFEDGNEIAILYVDGGYVSLTLQRHWQIPAPFKGTLIGIPTGGSLPTARPTPPPGGKATRPPSATRSPAVTTRPPLKIVPYTLPPVDLYTRTPTNPPTRPPRVTAVPTRNIPDITVVTSGPGLTFVTLAPTERGFIMITPGTGIDQLIRPTPEPTAVIR